MCWSGKPCASLWLSDDDNEVVAMKNIKVLGTGCANCKTTITLIQQMADAKGVPVTLEKVEELRDIMGYGVMSTPAVVVDGKVVHAGGLPKAEDLARWIAA